MSGCGGDKYLFLCLNNFILPQELTSGPNFLDWDFLLLCLFIPCGFLLPRTAAISFLSPTQLLASKRSGKVGEAFTTILALLLLLSHLHPLISLIESQPISLPTSACRWPTFPLVTASQRARVLRISRNWGKAYPTPSIYNAIISLEKYV